MRLSQWDECMSLSVSATRKSLLFFFFFFRNSQRNNIFCLCIVHYSSSASGFIAWHRCFSSSTPTIPSFQVCGVQLTLVLAERNAEDPFCDTRRGAIDWRCTLPAERPDRGRLRSKQRPE